jgi:septum formation protein
LIIGCDTMIELDGKMIGKPMDAEDAFSILKSLDGRKHSVRTGVCLLTAQGKEELFSVGTEVEFGQLGESMISKYISTGESMYLC